MTTDDASSNDDPVVVASFTYAHEAKLLVSHLGARGVEAWTTGDSFAGVMPHASNAAGGIKVVVRRVDHRAASEFIATYRQPEKNNSDVEHGESVDSAGELPGDPWMRRAAAAGVFMIPFAFVYGFWLLLRYGKLPTSRKGKLLKVVAIASCSCAAYLYFALFLKSLS